MPLVGFYYTYGDDTDMIEKKWFPDLQKKYPDASWLRYNALVDDLHIGRIVTEYQSNDLFAKSKVIVIRNADIKGDRVFELCEALADYPISGNAVVLVGASWNKTTRLGKLIKKHFMVREFAKPEVKPFDLIDALNSKNSVRVLQQSQRLREADYNPLAVFSLLFGHFLLLRQMYDMRQFAPDVIARELKQHSFRVKKAMVAFRYWNQEGLGGALQILGQLDTRLRSWQYDEWMLIQMALLKLCF